MTSTQLSSLFKAGSGEWSFGPQISVPLFAGGKNVARTRFGAKVGERLQVAAYEKAIQTRVSRSRRCAGRRRQLCAPDHAGAVADRDPAATPGTGDAALPAGRGHLSERAGRPAGSVQRAAGAAAGTVQQTLGQGFPVPGPGRRLEMNKIGRTHMKHTNLRDRTRPAGGSAAGTAGPHRLQPLAQQGSDL